MYENSRDLYGIYKYVRIIMNNYNYVIKVYKVINIITNTTTDFV